jgi:hypothetical protein
MVSRIGSLGDTLVMQSAVNLGWRAFPKPYIPVLANATVHVKAERAHLAKEGA